MQKFLTNGANISEISSYSPMFDIETHTVYSKLENDIYTYISENFSILFSWAIMASH